jgi:hypothetical protein
VNEYRVTRLKQYTAGVANYRIPHEKRVGYYILAANEREAERIACSRWPDEGDMPNEPSQEGKTIAFDITLERTDVGRGISE